MEKRKDKWIEAIAKLTKMTQDNTLKWRSGEVPEFFKNLENVKVETVYLTKHKDRWLRIYEKRVKEYRTGIGFGLVGFERGYVWTIHTVLDFADPSGASLWIFPEIKGLENLLNAVKFQVAGVKDFLKDLLSE